MGRGVAAVAVAICVLLGGGWTRTGAEKSPCSMISKAAAEAIVGEHIGRKMGEVPTVFIGSHDSTDEVDCTLELKNHTPQASIAIWVRFPPFEFNNVEILRREMQGDREHYAMTTVFGRHAIWSYSTERLKSTHSFLDVDGDRMRIVVIVDNVFDEATSLSMARGVAQHVIRHFHGD